MKHFYKKGQDERKPTLLLLHGTGGTENDLLPIAEIIDPTASILGVRGNVSENGMNRYFKRIAEGVFDEEDLLFRTKELSDFLDYAAEQYEFDRNNIVAMGYSNGANIAGSLLFHYKNVLQGAILLHPMVPRRGVDLPLMKNLPVFIGAGKNDPICPAQETEDLAALLSEAGASVQVYWDEQGHQLTRGEIIEAAKWYKRLFK
ncbi:alpha/beta hydrolase [Virgibacillus sp. MG-45]|uniref:alpha/beta hydrolase n=1 Tax=Virgibacillus sp. MG-45 TaxID=3102791 RepID=UPI002ED9CA03